MHHSQCNSTITLEAFGFCHILELDKQDRRLSEKRQHKCFCPIMRRMSEAFRRRGSSGYFCFLLLRPAAQISSVFCLFPKLDWPPVCVDGRESRYRPSIPSQISSLLPDVFLSAAASFCFAFVCFFLTGRQKKKKKSELSGAPLMWTLLPAAAGLQLKSPPWPMDEAAA